MAERLYFRFYPSLFSTKPIESVEKNQFIGYPNDKLIKGKDIDDFIDGINETLQKFKGYYGLEISSIPMLSFYSKETNLREFHDKIKLLETILFFIGNADEASSFNTDSYTFEYENRNSSLLFKNNSYSMEPLGITYYLDLFTYEFRDSEFNLGLRNVLNKRTKLLETLSFEEAVMKDNVLRALVWYNKACEEIRRRNNHSAIIFLSIAFESFLNLPRQSKKDSFSYAIGHYLGSNDLLMDWSGKFYEARNDIIHVGEVTEESAFIGEDRHIEHSIVAKFVFQECIYRQLLLTDGLDYSKENREWSNNFITQKLLISNTKIFDKLLKRGRFNYKSILNSPELGNEYFSLLDSVKRYETPAGSKARETRRKYLKVIELSSKIMNDWAEDVLENHQDNLKEKPISITEDSFNPIEQFQQFKSIIEQSIPNSSYEMFTQWKNARAVLLRFWTLKLPKFILSESGKTIVDIINFIRASSLLADDRR